MSHIDRRVDYEAKINGLTLDSKISFLQQIKAAAEKATSEVIALIRLMAKVEDPLSTRKRLLMRAAQPILLYGTGVWASALDKEVYRNHLAQMQTSAYRLSQNRL